MPKWINEGVITIVALTGIGVMLWTCQMEPRKADNVPPSAYYINAKACQYVVFSTPDGAWQVLHDPVCTNHPAQQPRVIYAPALLTKDWITNIDTKVN